MVVKKKKRKRVYRLSDLEDIAEQLGARIHLQLVPVEMIYSDKGSPEKQQRKTTRHPTR